MSTQVRPLRLEDCSSLVELMNQLGHPASHEELTQRFQKLETASDDYLLVAENSSNEIVGFLHAKVVNSMHYHPSVEICSLVVSSSSRGGGIGRALMSASEDWARKKGYPTVWLRSNIKRDDAHRFYSSLEYKIIGTSHFFQKSLS